MTVELDTLGGVIKTAYEGNSDTNALTDARLALINDVPNLYKLDGSLALTGDMDAGGFTIENVVGIESTGTMTVAGVNTTVESTGITFVKAVAGANSTQLTLFNGGAIQLKSSSNTMLEYGVNGAFWEYYAPFTPYKVTTTQKNAISSPAAGMTVYDTTLNKLCVYTTAWETVTSS